MGADANFFIRLGLSNAAAVVTGLNQAIQLMGALVRQVKAAAREAREYSQVVEGHAVNVRRADEATAGLIDTIALHRAAAQLEQAGLRVTERQFQALAVRVLDYARATGTDATDALNQFVTTLRSGGREGLRRFGIELQNVREGTELGQAALAEFERRMGDATRQTESLADEFDRLGNVSSTLWSEMVSALEREHPALMRLLGSLTDALASVADRFANIREIAGQAEAGSLPARRAQLEQQLIERGVDLSSGRISWTHAESLSGVVRGIAMTSGYARETARMFGEYQRLNRQIRQDPDAARASHAAAQAAIEQRRRQQASPGSPSRGGGGGGASGGAWGRSAGDQRLADAEERALEQVDAIRREWEERESERKEEALREHQQMIEDAGEKQIAIEQRIADERAEIERRRSEEAQAILEAETKAFEENLRQREEAWENLHETLTNIGDAVRDVGQFFGKLGNIVGEVAGKNSAATKAMSVVEGIFLVGYNSVKAVTAFADMAYAIAKERYDQAALFAIAGAGYVAAAVEAGVKLGVSVGSVSNRGGGASAGPRRPENAVGQRPPSPYGDRQIVVNVNGPTTSRRVREDLQRMAADAERRGD